MKFLSKIKNWVGSSVSKTAATVVAGSALLIAGSTSHASEVTLPEVGVNVADYVTVCITSLGAVVAVAIGGTIAFFVIRAGIRALRSYVKA